ncbi:MAG: hypothetical protein KGJ36_02345 [Acidobacteriota bacterium]|nr:hypothetical protein [Acidobacteriota bacterium]
MSYGLAPRPGLDPDDLAALVAATESVLAAPVRREPLAAVPAWRFSGRWFNAAPFSNRRPIRR